MGPLVLAIAIAAGAAAVSFIVTGSMCLLRFPSRSLATMLGGLTAPALVGAHGIWLASNTAGASSLDVFFWSIFYPAAAFVALLAGVAISIYVVSVLWPKPVA